MEDACVAEYKSTLADLNCNSKPAITCMTILAEENIQYAPQIVKVICEHIHSVPPETKLPVLYLIDSIIKNVGKQYFTHFSQSIASIFTSVFQKVDENTRALMYKLRQTWNGIFPNKILYSIDTRVKQVDPAWPITAQPPTPSIHVNPKFLAPNNVEKTTNKPLSNQLEESEKLKAAQNEVLKTLFEKQKKLRELEEKKRELAAKQFLSSQLPHGTAESSDAQIGDPRIHAKLNPSLNQRDPRVKKALSVMLNKKSLNAVLKGPSSDSQKSVKDLKKIPSVVASATSNISTNSVSSITTAKPTVSIPSTLISSVVVQKQSTRSSPTKNISGKNIKDNSSKIHKPSQAFTGNRKESVKNNEKSCKHDQSSVPPSKALSGKRKRRSDEKTLDFDKTGNISPSKKLHREKGPKKKESSPKSKNVNKSENSKDSKKHLRSRSRSPIPKVVKNRERCVDSDPRVRRKENLPETKLRDTSGEVISKAEQKLKISNDVGNSSPLQNTEDSKENVEDLSKETDSSEKNEDNIFARQDQDYRPMSESMKSGPQKGWAMYKAAHPEQFKTLHSSTNNEKRGFEEFKKMPQRPGRVFYDNGRGEYDKLGRPRISRMRIMQSNFMSRFPPRDFDNRFGGRNSFMDRRLHDIFSGNPKDVLRQAKEQYQLGRISENEFRELERDLERAWASEEYQRFKEMQQHSRNIPPFDEFNVPFDERDRQIFHNRMDAGFSGNNGPHPVNDGPQFRMNDRGHSVPPPDTSTFRLDNKNRVIHFIDDKAVILLDNGEPRELIFRGQPTQVEIEGLKPIILRFDGKPVNFELNGTMHSVKFGAPSREVYINNIPYKGKFGGPPFEFVLGGQIRRVRLCGPQPQVQVIDCPVSEDLHRRVMARTRGHNVQNTPMHLDVDMRGNASLDPANKDTDLRLSGPEIDDRRENSQFSNVSNYRGQPVFNVPNPGQLPMRGNPYRENLKDPGHWERQDDPNKVPSISKHLRRLDSGRLQNMPHQDGPYPCEPKPPTSTASFSQHPPPIDAPWAVRDYISHETQGPPSAQVPESVKTYNVRRNSPQPLDSHLKEFPDAAQRPTIPGPLHPGYITEPPRMELNQSNIQNRLPHPPLPPWVNNPPPPIADQNALPALPPPPRPPLLMGVGPPPDLQSVTLPVSVTPVSVSGGSTTVPPLAAPPPFPLQPVAAAMPPAFDIGTLFDKLLAAGIISKPSLSVKEEEEEKKETKEEENSTEEKKVEDDEEEEEEEVEQDIPPIEWKMDSLKGRYFGVIGVLYKGSECQSCGMRFRDPERYSRHLDWHFRMNRREKDGVKKAFSRKWYYEVEDWIQFEEFVDIDDRARSFFEMQADQQYEMEEPTEQPSVPTMGREAEACVVCGETFKLFWVEEEEEWHLKNAVRHDNQVYHPSCYEDFKKASEKAAAEPEGKDIVIKEEPLSPVKETVIHDEKDLNVDADIASIKIEIDDSVTDLMQSLVTLVVEGSEIKTEPSLEVDENVDQIFDPLETMEQEEEVLQGKPGEEEIIGIITESEEMDNVEQPPIDDSEKVVIESGGIVMKFRAESLKPASPATDTSVEKDSVAKDNNLVEMKEEEEEDEFRPPTPDPRFKQMPPVQRGLELSGMCCIM